VSDEFGVRHGRQVRRAAEQGQRRELRPGVRGVDGVLGEVHGDAQQGEERAGRFQQAVDDQGHRDGDHVGDHLGGEPQAEETLVGHDRARGGRRIARRDQALPDADLGPAAEQDHGQIQEAGDAGFQAGRADAREACHRRRLAWRNRRPHVQARD
jgi:hypothetical protein